MNDPHVESLTYKLTPGPSFDFKDDAPARDVERPDFNLHLEKGIALVTMKSDYATADEARRVVQPFLRAWEVSAALDRGKSVMRFTFVDAKVIDRNPTPGVHILVGAGALTIGADMGATAILTMSRYPDPPPTGFSVTLDVETLWRRYERYVADRRQLLSMGYFCLSALQTIHGGPQTRSENRAGGQRRTKAANALGVDRAVLDKLGELTSERGDGETARKRDGRESDLTGAEADWIQAALRELIRRQAMRDGEVSLLKMGDLPPLL
jgi:hypothetical protein